MVRLLHDRREHPAEPQRLPGLMVGYAHLLTEVRCIFKGKWHFKPQSCAPLKRLFPFPQSLRETVPTPRLIIALEPCASEDNQRRWGAPALGLGKKKESKGFPDSSSVLVRATYRIAACLMV